VIAHGRLAVERHWLLPRPPLYRSLRNRAYLL